MGVVETGGGQGGSTLSAGDAQPPFQAGYVQCGDWYRVAVLSHYCAHVSGGARYGGLIASVLLLVVTTVVLKYTWYRPLCREEKEYDELMKRIGMD